MTKRLKAIIKAIDTERYVTMGENKFESNRSTRRVLEIGSNHGCCRYELWEQLIRFG